MVAIGGQGNLDKEDNLMARWGATWNMAGVTKPTPPKKKLYLQVM